MTTVGIRDLRTRASELLRLVEAGETLTVTVDRRPVAEIIPLRRREWVPRAEAVAALRRRADPGMAELLADLRAERVEEA